MQRPGAVRRRGVVVRRAQAEAPAGQEDAVPAAFPPGPGRVVADHVHQLRGRGPAAQEGPHLGRRRTGQVGDDRLADPGVPDGELAGQAVASEGGDAVQVGLGQPVFRGLVQFPAVRLARVHEVDQHPAVAVRQQHGARPQPGRPPVAAGHVGERDHQPGEVRAVARPAGGVLGADDDLGAGAGGDGARQHLGAPALERLAGADVGEPARRGRIERAVPVQDREDAIPYPGRAGHVPALLPLRLLTSPPVVIGLS